MQQRYATYASKHMLPHTLCGARMLPDSLSLPVSASSIAKFF